MQNIGSSLKCIRHLERNENAVVCLIWVPQSPLQLVGGLGSIWSGMKNGSMLVWNVSTAELIRETTLSQTNETVTCFLDLNGSILSGSSYQLDCGTAGGRLCLWDSVSGSLLRELNYIDSPIFSLRKARFQSVTGRPCAWSGCGDGILRLWDTGTGVLLQLVQCCESPIHSILSVGTNSTLWAACGFEGVKAFTEKEDGSLEPLSIFQTAEAKTLVHHRDRVFSAGSSGILMAWDIQTRVVRKIVEVGKSVHSMTLALGFLWIGVDLGVVQILDVEELGLVNSYNSHCDDVSAMVTVQRDLISKSQSRQSSSNIFHMTGEENGEVSVGNSTEVWTGGGAKDRRLLVWGIRNQPPLPTIPTPPQPPKNILASSFDVQIHEDFEAERWMHNRGGLLADFHVPTPDESLVTNFIFDSAGESSPSASPLLHPFVGGPSIRTGAARLMSYCERRRAAKVGNTRNTMFRSGGVDFLGALAKSRSASVDEGNSHNYASGSLRRSVFGPVLDERGLSQGLGIVSPPKAQISAAVTSHRATSEDPDLPEAPLPTHSEIGREAVIIGLAAMAKRVLKGHERDNDSHEAPANLRSSSPLLETCSICGNQMSDSDPSPMHLRGSVDAHSAAASKLATRPLRRSCAVCGTWCHVWDNPLEPSSSLKDEQVRLTLSETELTIKSTSKRASLIDGQGSDGGSESVSGVRKRSKSSGRWTLALNLQLVWIRAGDAPGTIEVTSPDAVLILEVSDVRLWLNDTQTAIWSALKPPPPGPSPRNLNISKSPARPKSKNFIEEWADTGQIWRSDDDYLKTKSVEPPPIEKKPTEAQTESSKLPFELRNSYALRRKAHTFADGVFYDGEWRRGVPWGEGSMRLLSGARYRGYFSDGRPNGFGVFLASDCKYWGHWKRGILHGLGALWENDGAVYNGHLRYGRRQGFGQHVFANQDVYGGEWRCDRACGEGHFINAVTGAEYSGQWRDGVREGRGKMSYGDMSTYEGWWKGNLREGSGRYESESSGVYEGSFREDARHGQGIQRYTSGAIFIGIWEENIPNGPGRLIHANGSVFRGTFKKGMIDGAGVMTFPNGDTMAGSWRENTNFPTYEQVTGPIPHAAQVSNCSFIPSDGPDAPSDYRRVWICFLADAFEDFQKLTSHPITWPLSVTRSKSQVVSLSDALDFRHEMISTILRNASHPLTRMLSIFSVRFLAEHASNSPPLPPRYPRLNATGKNLELRQAETGASDAGKDVEGFIVTFGHYCRLLLRSVRSEIKPLEDGEETLVVRRVVTDFVWPLVYHRVLEIFREGHKTEDREAIDKMRELTDGQLHRPRDLMMQFEIDDEFQILPPDLDLDSPAVKSASAGRSRSNAKFRPDVSSSVPRPYYTAIQALRKLPFSQSPEGKARCLTETFSAIVDSIEEYYAPFRGSPGAASEGVKLPKWKNNSDKIEITADSLIPIAAFVAARAQIVDMHSQLAFVEMFLPQDLHIRQEGCSLTNMQIALNWLKTLTRKTPDTSDTAIAAEPIVPALEGRERLSDVSMMAADENEDCRDGDLDSREEGSLCGGLSDEGDEPTE